MKALAVAAAIFASASNLVMVGGGGLQAALVIPASPLFLPETACHVKEEAYQSLAMQIRYAEAVKILGCEGVHVHEDRLGDSLVIKEYAWRADTWPFGAVRAEFYNDTLQAKSELRYALSWSE